MTPRVGERILDWVDDHPGTGRYLVVMVTLTFVTSVASLVVSILADVTASW